MQQEATFGAGCFWGVEEQYRTLPGVISTEVGYIGGKTEHPTYEQVCSDRTGHAEAVHIVFDPEKVTYKELLKLFWENHNPTTPNQQGPDVGSQYRSAIFYYTPEQKEEAEESLEEAQKSWPAPIVTEITPAAPFWKAEDYHQQYLAKRGIKVCH